MSADFLANDDRPLLESAALERFEALWALDLPSVDAPNVDRGGWSSVCRLDIAGAAYYLKRQCNHLTRGWRHPFGEPTFTREFRNIRRCAALGVPVLHVAFHGERRTREGQCAILLTRALEDWRDLEDWFSGCGPANPTRPQLLFACGRLARTLHQAGLMHGAFYPRHTFARAAADGFQTCLIDLEKTRSIVFPQRDRLRDIEQFARHARLSEEDIRALLCAYLDASPSHPEVAAWEDTLHLRGRKKTHCVSG
jgi:tRNA A-37 threonylcarbamoyl transferase component Bud32